MLARPFLVLCVIQLLLSCCRAFVMGLNKSDCESIHIPTDPESKLPQFTVRYSSDARHCTVECDPRREGKFILGCMTFMDGAVNAMTRAQLWSDETCQKTIIEAPNKAPNTTDPETVIESCPSWFLYAGWDRGEKRTLGNIRQELALKERSSLDAFEKALPPAPTLTTSRHSVPQLLLATAGLSEADCRSIPIPVDHDSKMQMFTLRYSEDGKHCTVECDPVRNGTLVTGCVAFVDGVIDSMNKAGLWSDEQCHQTMLEAPDKDPETTDPELSVSSCPSWLLYDGWDRGLKRTLGNSRQELTLKTEPSLTAFKSMLLSAKESVQQTYLV